MIDINYISSSLLALMSQPNQQRPAVKTARFSQKQEIFNYSINKTGDSQYEDMLLSPPSDIKKQRAKRKQSENVIKLNGQLQAQSLNWETIEKQYEELLKQIEDDRKKQLDNQEKERQKQKMIMYEANVRQTQNKELLYEQQVPLQTQEVHIKQGIVHQPMEIQFIGVNNKTQPNSLVNVQENHTQIQLSQANSNAERQATAEIKSQNNKRKDRVTLDTNAWLKLLGGSFSKTSSSNQVNSVEKESNMQLQQIKSPSFHEPNANNLQNQQQESKTFQINQRKSIFGNLSNNRITLDIQSIANLLQKNVEKYERISNSFEHNPYARKSVGFYSRDSQVSRQQLQNDQYITSYFDGLLSRKQNRKINSEYLLKHLKQLQQLTEKSRQEGKRIKQQLKKEEQKVTRLIKQREQMNLSDISLSQQKYLQMQQPIWYMQYMYNLEVLKFFNFSNKSKSLYCEAILDNDIFIKIRREEESPVADLRISYNVVLDYEPRDWLLDIKSRIQLLRLYFQIHLAKGDLMYILKELAVYYKQFQSLQNSLNQSFSIFPVDDLQISRNFQKLSFRIILKPEFTLIISIWLMRLRQVRYIDCYHIEGNEDLRIPQSMIEDKDFLSYLMAIINYRSQ